VAAKEFFQRRAREVSRIAGRKGFEKLQKLLAVRVGKPIRRMANYVGMRAFAKIEANRTAAWVSIGVVVGYHRDAGEVRKARGYRSRGAIQVRRFAKRRSVR